MKETVDLSIFSMGMTAMLLLIPLAVVWRLKLGVTKSMLIAALRMSVQLLLIGFFLEYLFKYNYWLLNIAWLLAMIMVASHSVIDNSGLNFKTLALPVITAFALANFVVVIYFNVFITQLQDVFNAKYIIAIGGMILGNSLRANVVGLGDFYQALRKNESHYFFRLSLGASKYEALLPFAKKSFLAAINPSIASMATMGIVSLPGMMTGQILGGSVPMVAIKYQIAIMVAILTSTVLSILLSLLFTGKTAFNQYGVIRPTVFSTKK